MRKLIATLLSLIGLGHAAAAATPPAEPAQLMTPEAEMARDLRQMALDLQPADIGITRDTYPQRVWGVLMETAYEEGFFTLVVLADGSTSLYFSNGGGVIGAGDHDSVRRAGADFLAEAEKAVSATTPTQSTPVPALGETHFHLLTFDGKRTYAAQEVDLGEGRDELSSLFHAGHAVITAVRQTQPQSADRSP